MATKKKQAEEKPKEQPEEKPTQGPLAPQVTSPQVYDPGHEQPINLPKGPSLGDDAEKKEAS